MYYRLPPYDAILAGVLTAMQVNEGIIKLTGKAGAGKTALCSELFRELEAAGRQVVFFMHPPGTAEEMQKCILAKLQLNSAGNFTRQLTARLKERPSGNLPLVLLFDDAQDIDASTFTFIRLLCNIQDESRALVSIILCGADALDEQLADPAYRALTQFLSQSFTLAPMDKDQVRDFCSAFWQHHGMTMPVMDDKKLLNLCKETRGLPAEVLALLQPEPGAYAVQPVRPYADVQLPASKAMETRLSQFRKAALYGLGLALLAGAGTLAWRFIAEFETPSAPTPYDARTTDLVADAEPAAAPLFTDPVDVEVVPFATGDVDGTAVEELAVEELAVETITVQALAADETAVDEITVDEIAVDEIAVDEIAVDEIAVEQSFAGEEIAVAEPLAAAVAGTEVAPEETGTPVGSVEAFLASWLASWQRQDVDSYLAHYHQEFSPVYESSITEWRAHRRETISNAERIELAMDAIENRGGGANAQTVRFWLTYRSANYADATLKELILEREPDESSNSQDLSATQWRIRSERNLQIDRL